VIEPYTIDIPDAALRDLSTRLAATRWPAGVVDRGGLPRASLEPVVDYWRDSFDWPSRQRALNEWPHFMAEVRGVRIHFIHVRAAKPDAPVLLLLHGWPGSFLEMLPVAKILAGECDVVIPSIPGFGFSSIAERPGMSNRRIAELLTVLMSALGYDTFAVHGGDIGAGVATWMALDFRDRLAALHLNYIPGSYAPPSANDLTAEERAFLEYNAQWSQSDGAYAHMQRTTPLTPAYALSDSPVGLAAWILEKFELWADPASEIDVDTLLTNVSLYWFTNTIAGSMRYYLESSLTPLALRSGQRISVPTAIARFPLETPFPPRSWIERGYDITRWTDMPRGGHFAALEAPELLARDLAEWLRSS
jgi:pimeloyl-ACP methyl ester carboxylesterase